MLEACVGGLCWRPALEACVGGLRWRPALEACVGDLRWRPVLEACVEGLCWRLTYRSVVDDGLLPGLLVLPAGHGSALASLQQHLLREQ